MAPWTRRSAMLVVGLCLVTGCASASPSASPTPTAVVAPSPPSNETSQPPAPSPTGHVPAPAATESPTQVQIDSLTLRIQADPDDPSTQRDLGLALLQRIRETADPSLYAAAEQALLKSKALDPTDALTFVGLGALDAGRHRFAEALDAGRAAVTILPELAPAHGVVVDALVELGRYDEAQAEVDRMLSLSSDIGSLARKSYLLELHGDLKGALAAMREAAAAPSSAAENVAYLTALVGNLEVANGDPVAANASYEAALKLVPTHAPSIAGLGRLAIGRGDLTDAAAQFERAAAILPLPEYVVALGEIHEAAGDAAKAKASFDLARVEITLFQANGVTVDLELALFESDHGDPARGLELAHAAYAATPTVRAADAVGWALHRSGRDQDALAFVKEALRLGSRDPLLRYHAGAIEAALGQDPDAIRDLNEALTTDPGFSALGAKAAREILATLH